MACIRSDIRQLKLSAGARWRRDRIWRLMSVTGTDPLLLSIWFQWVWQRYLSDCVTKQAYGHHKKVDCSGDEGVQLRKLNGSSVETPSYQNLHRELLLSHKRGLLHEEKPELQRVLEQRRLELHREEEMAQRRPSDLETELRKRQQKLQEYEQEEIRQRENQQKIPEFVRVKDNLRRTQTSEH
ncbi:protein FAM107B [Anoplopoma fimbria]|uniref:protein FAM107B n=1 Tax=Anoplopoma fimbria TaxID=229290 RepID=UPI0023ED846F|nr:protein FAM107B [Anoplopoma fimbria]